MVRACSCVLGGFKKLNKMCFKKLGTFRTASPFSRVQSNTKYYSLAVRKILTFCETTDRYRTLLLTMFHLVQSPISIIPYLIAHVPFKSYFYKFYVYFFKFSLFSVWNKLVHCVAFGSTNNKNERYFLGFVFGIP